MGPFYSLHIQIKHTIVIPYGGVSTVSQRAGAPVAYSGHIVRIPTKYPGFNFGHETAVFVPDNMPDDLILLHLSPANRMLEIIYDNRDRRFLLRRLLGFKD